MIVILNNGVRIRVVNAMVQAMCKNILTGEAQQWQWQLDPNENGVAGFNLSQVAAICREEDIVPDKAELLKMADLYLKGLPTKDESGKFWAERFREFLAGK